MIADYDAAGVGHLFDGADPDGREAPSNGVEQEWEALFQGYKVANLTIPNLLPPVAQQIELFRDDFYEIGGKVRGEFRDHFSQVTYFASGSDQSSAGSGGQSKYKEYYIGYKAGERVQSFDVEGKDQSGKNTIVLRNCVETGFQTGAGRELKYVSWIEAGSVANILADPSDTAMLIEWFLNGPRSYVYPRYTARTMELPFRKRRIFPDNEAEILGEPIRQSVKADFAFVRIGETAFAIQAVPEGVGPHWSKNIGLEYRREWGRIPDAHERELIKEAVAFVIGRALLSVGYSSYDRSGRAIEKISTSPGLPRNYNIISVCRLGDSSPIDFQSSALENSLEQLIPNYLKMRDGLRLNEALYRYWFAKITPVGFDLPMFAAALEGLASAWHKSVDAKIANEYLPVEAFEALLGDELASIEQKLSGIKFGDRILRRIKGAYRMGANEQLDYFFSDINLNLGSVEKKAIRSRNPMAHGSSLDFSDEEFDKVVRIRWAYQTLFERVLLRILGYTGNYVDRSSDGWSQRALEDPMEGLKPSA